MADSNLPLRCHLSSLHAACHGCMHWRSHGCNGIRIRFFIILVGCLLSRFLAMQSCLQSHSAEYYPSAARQHLLQLVTVNSYLRIILMLLSLHSAEMFLVMFTLSAEHRLRLSLVQQFCQCALGQHVLTMLTLSAAAALSVL